MSSDIASWHIRSISMELPARFLRFEVFAWLRSQADSEGKQWCLDHAETFAFHERGNLTWKLIIVNQELSGQDLVGIMGREKFVVTGINWTGEGSGLTCSAVLLPLFSEFRGTLEAQITWEDGTVTDLHLINGMISS
jgi:hypothetical protein